MPESLWELYRRKLVQHERAAGRSLNLGARVHLWKLAKYAHRIGEYCRTLRRA